jgi:hypothetical protein
MAAVDRESVKLGYLPRQDSNLHPALLPVIRYAKLIPMEPNAAEEEEEFELMNVD